MSATDALQRLQRGASVNCITPDGLRFQVQSKVDSGIAWYRAYLARRGCLNHYSRLSNGELMQWLESVIIEGD